MEKKKIFTRKRVAGIMSVLLIAALLLGGTFAFVDFGQHKTNFAKGGENVSVTLNDSYQPSADWKAGQILDKKVSVTNTLGGSDPIFVRVQFKEYFEMSKLRLVKDGTGKALLFATYAEGAKKGEFMTWADAEAGGYDYVKHTVTFADNTTKDFALTQNTELRNGIYGKEMYIPSKLKVFGNAVKANYPTQPHETQSDTNLECKYPTHKWDTCGIEADDNDQIHNYISWKLGQQIMDMGDWVTAGKPTGDFWVLDAIDGWAYWANAVQPGKHTSNIMESIKLDNMPGNNFEYYIHIDMQAVTVDQLDELKTKGATSHGKDLIDELKKPTVGWADNGDGTATKYEIVNKVLVSKETVIMGLDGVPGTGDDNKIVNPVQTVLKIVTSADIKFDGTAHYVPLGNGINLYPREDGTGPLGSGNDIVKGFGEYAQSDATGVVKDPINWRLLDIQGTKAVIVSDTVLDNLKFNNSQTDDQIWGTSNLRNWLNSSFYNTAFSAGEKAKIASTNVSMASETFRALATIAPATYEWQDFVTDAQSGTVDNVWALSGTETWKYFGKSKVITPAIAGASDPVKDPENYTNAVAKGNAYSYAKGSTQSTNEILKNNASYWLRSPGITNIAPLRATTINSYGYVNVNLALNNATIGARPAITVNLVS